MKSIVSSCDYTQDGEKHNTICVGHYCTQRNTNNVNKTWALLQTTGCNDESNIVYMLFKISKSRWNCKNSRYLHSVIECLKELYFHIDEVNFMRIYQTKW